MRPASSQQQIWSKRVHEAALRIYIAQLDGKHPLAQQDDAALSGLATDCLRAARALLRAEKAGEE